MVFTIAVIVFALSFVIAGRIQDKFGPLGCSLAGGILVSLGTLIWRISVARKIAEDAGLDPNTATAVTLL